jgi:DNA-binding NtrC family response regulator
LVIDGDEKVQRGLAALLSGAGLVPTVLSDPERARVLLKEKYIPVVVLDLDTPEPNAGLTVVRWVKQELSATAVFVMTGRKSFEPAVEAFRAGALDVVVKAPDQVQYLKQRVVEAAIHAKRRDENDRLITEVAALHEEFLKRLLETSRRASELEEQLGGGSHPSVVDVGTAVLVVEPQDADWLVGQLQQLLRSRVGYKLVVAPTGAEALDMAGGERFNIALVCDGLPDLPGTMVVSGLKSITNDLITILYSPPGARPGKAEIVEGHKSVPLVAELTDAKQILMRLDELRDAAHRTSRERRYLASFRQENWELLRRYADLKAKLERAGHR